MTITREHLIDLIEASKLERWEGLRKVDGADELLALPNDDGLRAQYEGLTRALAITRELVGYDAIEPANEDIALAYALRQMQPDENGAGVETNHLLNAQNVNTKTAEAKNLEGWASLEFAIDDISLPFILKYVARSLRGTSESDPLVNTITKHLEIANAYFYLDTGLQAAQLAEQETNLNAKLAYQLLAANAFRNNIHKITGLGFDYPDGHPIAVLLSGLGTIDWIDDQRLYESSLGKAKAQPTSSTAPVTAAQTAAAVPPPYPDHGRAP